MSNYTTKADSRNATRVHTWDFAKKSDLANLKSDVDKLDINKWKNVPTSLSNLKSKVEAIDVDKLVPVSVDLGKISNVVKDDAVKNTYIMLISKILKMKYLILLTWLLMLLLML